MTGGAATGGFQRIMNNTRHGWVGILLLGAMLWSGTAPLLAQDGAAGGAAAPLEIPDPAPTPVHQYAPAGPAEGGEPAAAWANPTLDMAIVDVDLNKINQQIPLTEDIETEFTAISSIYGAGFDCLAQQFPGGAWLKNPNTVWLIHNVQAGSSQIADANGAVFKAAFKNPGEYLVSCFADRDFNFPASDQLRMLTALSSRGIGCFVADVTPPEFSLELVDADGAQKTTLAVAEHPRDLPPGKKKWALKWEGAHFDPTGRQVKRGDATGDLPRVCEIDLRELNCPDLALKKDTAYQLKIEAKDNYQVAAQNWSIVDFGGRTLIGGNPESVVFPSDKAFIGRNALVVEVADPGGNFQRVKIPLRVIPK